MYGNYPSCCGITTWSRELDIGPVLKKVSSVHSLTHYFFKTPILTLVLLTWRIWWAPNNASKWQMGFNSAFKFLFASDPWCLYSVLFFFLNLFLYVLLSRLYAYVQHAPKMSSTLISSPPLLPHPFTLHSMNGMSRRLGKFQSRPWHQNFKGRWL